MFTNQDDPWSRLAEVGEEAEECLSAAAVAPDRPLYARANDLAQIQVHLTIELGRIPLSALAVVGLRPGMTLEVPEREDGTLELSLDGETLGRGTLREEDGRVVVEILSLDWEQTGKSVDCE